MASIGIRLTLMLAFTVNVAEGQIGFRTIARSGEQAVGTPTGVIYSGFTQALLNDSGQTAFLATLSGVGVTTSNNSAIAKQNFEGELLAVARTQDQGTDLPSGVTYATLGSLRLNDLGQVAFSATLAGSGVTGTNGMAILSEGVGALSTIARSGNMAPGQAVGVTYEGIDFSSLQLNSDGQAAYGALLTGPGVTIANSDALFAAGLEGTTVIARAGEQAAGLSPGVEYAGFLQLSNAGSQLGYFANLRGSGVTSSNDTAIFSDRGGEGLAPIVREGSPAGGLATGVNYSDLSLLRFNSSSNVAFRARLSGVGVTSASDTAIFREGAGSGPVAIAREGSQAATLPTGVNYSTFNNLQINDAGETAFFAFLSGSSVNSSNNEAIFSEGGGNGLRPVVRSGDPAPGLPAGTKYYETADFRINNQGQTAFYATVANGANLRDGLFIHDPSVGTQLVAIVGQSFDVNDDPMVSDFRTISSLSFSIDFNTHGELAFIATFSDNSQGVFVATPSLAGDYNADGVIDAADYTVWRDSLNSTTQLAADGDRDGQVDQGDYAVWAQNYGRGNDQSNIAVPEPGAAMILLAAGLLSTRRPTTAC